MGAAYRAFAMANPQRYQLIFGAASPASVAGHRTDVTSTGGATDRAEWAASFEALRNTVRRMIAAGRIRDDGELNIAGRLWSLSHGEVMLELAGFFGHEGHGLTQILGPLAVDTLVGMGDERRGHSSHSLRQRNRPHLRLPREFESCPQRSPFTSSSSWPSFSRRAAWWVWSHAASGNRRWSAR